MKKYLYFLLTVAIIGFFACEDDTPTSGNFGLGVPFELEANQILSCTCDTDFTIKFEQVVEDSRCPTEVLCIWPGQVIVKLGLEGIINEDIELTLNDSKPELRFDTLGGHVFELLEVNPYPEAGDPIDFEDYTLKMKVTEL